MGRMLTSEFESAYRAHFSAVWRTVRRLGIAEKDAIDAAQEVFVVAYRRRDDFEGRSSVRTWLLGIAFRVAAARRNSAAARREELGDAAVARAEGRFDPERGLEGRELLQALDSALDALPLEQRAVFTLFEMEGLTGEEIAEALGVPVGTVRSRLRLARKAFARFARELRRELEALELSGGLA
jgi:RNA polymerase sigma-70 factor (ECF subfamily)